ncbi:MAG TPA: LuxR C-terminal-related transcriptional regulator, partial [Chloroflexia bacterium]|nr:LuxR C-terminal-related transcriptional regulator [Chloroflexia bacterium]
TYLLDHQPAEVHLVIASRCDPPLPLAAYRAAGELIEVRAADLRFTPEEVRAFAGRFPHLAPAPEQFVARVARAEGWAAGLQLAALAMQAGDAAAPGAEPVITGKHKYIGDYLAQEVLAHQPPAVQTFLRHTAILDRLCAPLCNAVTGSTEGQALLEQLERANLFLVPLDTERGWYRYHDLFADFLRVQFAQQSAPQRQTLHRRAGQWYAAQGMAAEAIDHALAGADFPVAGQLIGRAAAATVQRGDVRTLHRWMTALPAALVQQSAGLCLWYAWALYLTGDLRAVEPYLHQAEKHLAALRRPDGPDGPPDPADCLPIGDPAVAHAQIAVIRACVAQARADGPGTRRHAEAALPYVQQPGEDDPVLHAIARMNLGAAVTAAGDLEAAAREFQRAARISTAAGDLYNAVTATQALADLAVLRGDLMEARALYSEALRVFASDPAQAQPALGMLYIGLGEIAYEQDALADAVACLERGIHMAQAGGHTSSRVRGHVALARTRHALGEGAAAQREIEQAAALAHQAHAASDIHFLRLWQARLAPASNGGRAARMVAGDPEAGGPVPIHRRRLLADLATGTRLRAALQAGTPGQIMAALAVTEEATAAGGPAGPQIEWLMLKALALHAQGKQPAAVTCLGRALALATPGGWVRLFVDEGRPLLDLLDATLAWQRRPPPGTPEAAHRQTLEYGQRLREALHADLGRRGAPVPPAPQTQLSAREIEVLRQLLGPGTYHDIATALFVSEDTAKWHIKNIYRKLGVSSRAHLAERVTHLGLRV